MRNGQSTMEHGHGVLGQQRQALGRATWVFARQLHGRETPTGGSRTARPNPSPSLIFLSVKSCCKWWGCSVLEDTTAPYIIFAAFSRAVATRGAAPGAARLRHGTGTGWSPAGAGRRCRPGWGSPVRRSPSAAGSEGCSQDPGGRAEPARREHPLREARFSGKRAKYVPLCPA